MLPLTPLYDGPYAVIHRSLRAFKLQIGGKEDNASTSRLKPCSSSTLTASPPARPWLHTAADPPPRVRFDLTPQPAAADSGTVFPAQPCRFFECPEEATKSCYPRRQCGPPPGLKDYSFFLSHRDQEAGGTYEESRPSLRTAPHHPCTY